MKDYNYYLNELGEIGYVEKVAHSVVYSSGLPGVRPLEVVLFETGEIGQVLSLKPDFVEILLLSRIKVRVGTQVARTGELLQVPVSDKLLGRIIDPLMHPLDNGPAIPQENYQPIDIQPHSIQGRQEVNEPFETGVTLIDLVVPLSKGQRELVIGDRKTGKTEFLLQTLLTQSLKGAICIYALIGQRLTDTKRRSEFMIHQKIMANSIIIATTSSDPSGLIFLTPYTAMTIAEHFRDQGKDVFLILHDLSTHAKYYREISLLSRRFPGRSSYPGDIFYTHARLIERAGKYARGTITLMPVAESLLGDLSGYIQTNLMAMTDGHIFFDIDLYNRGKRPAVNQALSVTRIGHQSQTVLQRDISRELSSFLINLEKVRQFLHFGSEIGDEARQNLELGAKLESFFGQSNDKIREVNASILIVAMLWSGFWNEVDIQILLRDSENIILDYRSNKDFKQKIDGLISSSKTFKELIKFIKEDQNLLKVKN